MADSAVAAVRRPGTDSAGHRLLWHGFLLFLLGLLVGFAVQATTNPRMALSAHLEGVMNGMFLAILGLAWDRLDLAPRPRTVLFGLALYGTYANLASTTLSAVFGTSRMTPLAGAGFTAAPWQEAVVAVGLVSLSIAMVAVCTLVLWGLGRAARRFQ